MWKTKTMLINTIKMEKQEKTPPVFDLFVRLKDSKLPSGKFIHETKWSIATGKRCFTFNGNKYDDEPVKQLIAVNNLKNRLFRENKYSLLMIRDRRKVPQPGTFADPSEYTVYKSVNDILEVDRCVDYINAMLKEVATPKTLVK
jgi:hypothetical protein